MYKNYFLYICLSVCMFAIHFVSFELGSVKLDRMVEYHAEHFIIFMFGVGFRAVIVKRMQIEHLLQLLERESFSY